MIVPTIAADQGAKVEKTIFTAVRKQGVAAVILPEDKNIVRQTIEVLTMVEMIVSTIAADQEAEVKTTIPTAIRERGVAAVILTEVTNIVHQVVEMGAIETTAGILHKDQNAPGAMTMMGGLLDLKKCTELIQPVQVEDGVRM
jgi:hypothetical protein